MNFFLYILVVFESSKVFIYRNKKKFKKLFVYLDYNRNNDL